MTTTLRAVLCLSLPALFAGSISPQTRADYRFRFTATDDLASVQVRFEGCTAERFDLAMPAWKPGSYTIHDFGKNVGEVHAHDGDGNELRVEGDDPNSWHVHANRAPVIVIDYVLHTKRTAPGIGPGYSLAKGLGRPSRTPDGEAPDGESDAAKDGPGTWPAYGFEGPATWMYVPGHLDIPHRVTFELPKRWDVATGMTRTTANQLVFEAPDYDVFADCPFHVGHFERLPFKVDGVRYEIVLSGFERDRHDRKELVERYETIVAAHHEFWGKPPYDRYVFLIAYPGGGGLEHLNSCDMGMMDLSGSTPDRPSAWDSLVSHEFFHAWNVKRLRPEALGPFDYTGPTRTRFLWLCEGVTSYYGDLLLVRAGLWDAEHFWLDAIPSEMRNLQRNPGRLKMSIAEASWTVWDAPYMRRGRTAPDYYNKGELLGLLLDVEIRSATAGKRSLDDVMRAVATQCMETGKGFADDDFRTACEKLSGRSFQEFFERYVDGTDELPYAEVLAKIGLKVSDSADEGDEEGQPDRPRRRSTIRVDFDKQARPRAVKLREAITARPKR